MTQLLRSLLLCFLTVSGCLAQSVFRIDSLPPQGVLLDKGWKWQVGDNLNWANVDVNDSNWEHINPTKDIFELPQIPKTGQIGWLRLHLAVGNALNNQLVLVIQQSGASEIFLDGKLIHHFGVVSTNPFDIQAFNPAERPVSLPINNQSTHLLAIRYALQPGVSYTTHFGMQNNALKITLNTTENAIKRYSDLQANFQKGPFTRASLFGILCVLFLSLFLFFPTRKVNLYFSIYAFLMAFMWFNWPQLKQPAEVKNYFILNNIMLGIQVIAYSFMLTSVYYTLEQKKNWFFWSVLGLGTLSIATGALIYGWGWFFFGFVFTNLINIDITRIALIALRQGKKGTWIIVVGGTVYLLSWIIFCLQFAGLLPWSETINSFDISLLCIPVSFAIYLGFDTAQANLALAQKLVEVETLSTEKQRILASQNETLERQVAERTAQLEHINRNLVIEAALEEVRSRSLAMRTSNELRDVVYTVVERLNELGLELAAANIILFTEGSKGIISWTKTNTDDAYSNGFYLPYNDEPAVADFFNAIKNRAGLFTKSYTFDEKKAFWENLFERSDFRHVPTARKTFLLEVEYFSLSIACCDHTGLVITRCTKKPFSETENDILQRFAHVFEQAYTRFLDLQRAELQVREAIKQASLDRVSGRIASMRTIDDLQRITPLIWQELTALQVSFIRCGVFIIDDTAAKVHTYLSTPDGKAIASFHLPYTSAGITADIVTHWHNRQSFTEHWTETELRDWGNHLADQGLIQSPESYVSDMPPRELFMHFVPFLQGMLYVGDVDPLSTDEIDLVQALANTFAAAYARYQDFNQLEAAKAQVDTALLELKSTQAQLVQKQKMASLGELTAGIAHEIQNPLNFVNNFSEVSTELVSELKQELERGDTNEAKAIADNLTQNLEKITVHGQRASSIVKGMLEHSRTATGERQPTDLNALCEEYLRLAYHGLRAKNKDFTAKLVTDLDPTLGEVKVVPQEIGRVMLNLFNNAFYAVAQHQKQAPTGYQPTVSIRTQRTDNQVEIRVTDNGVGIAEAVKGKVFQPFFTTKPTGEGTGLGLSLSYDIVTKSYGGVMDITTQEGKFTEFTVTLPTS